MPKTGALTTVFPKGYRGSDDRSLWVTPHLIRIETKCKNSIRNRERQAKRGRKQAGRDPGRKAEAFRAGIKAQGIIVASTAVKLVSITPSMCYVRFDFMNWDLV